MWQHIMYLCVCCFQCREVCGLAIASPHTSLHWKQYVVCYHIAHNNEIFIILIFKEYVLPEDDMGYAI